MIYVIDGGSLLNQEPGLFEKAETLIATVRKFIETFGPSISRRNSRLIFILKGYDNEARLVRRQSFAEHTVIFSNKPGGEEDLMLECVESALRHDECTVVCDNAERSLRATFIGAKAMRCARFAQYLEKILQKDLDSQRDENEIPNVKYWSTVFEISPDETFELKAPELPKAGAAEDKDE